MSSAVASAVAMAVAVAGLEYSGLPQAVRLLNEILSDPLRLAAAYLTLLIPLAAYGHLLLRGYEERQRRVEEDLRKARNLLDAYQVVINHLSNDVEALKREIEVAGLRGLAPSIAGLERRIAASERLIAALMEILGRG